VPCYEQVGLGVAVPTSVYVYPKGGLDSTSNYSFTSWDIIASIRYFVKLKMGAEIWKVYEEIKRTSNEKCNWYHWYKNYVH
jgi:hypothetical protein